MPFVTYSETPLSFDTLPAVKVYHYRNCAEEEMVYSYLKLFAGPEGLHLSFSIFEQAPAAESRAALTLCGAGKSRAYLLCSCDAFGQVQVSLHAPGGAKKQTLILGKTPIFTGADEQGPYWSAEWLLTNETLSLCLEQKLGTGTVFLGNFFKYWTDRSAFGSAFMLEAGQKSPGISGAAEFVVVPY